MDDTGIERELRESQAALLAADRARVRRQAAVTTAIAAGWSKYRIAGVLGVAAPTVTSIIEAAEKQRGRKTRT